MGKKGQTEISVVDHLRNNKVYNYVLLFSGLEKNGIHGVGIIVSSDKMKFLRRWDSSMDYPGRIMWATFEGTNVISFYTHTESKRVCRMRRISWRSGLYHILRSISGLARVLKVIQESMGKIGLNLAMEKTEILRVSSSGKVESFI